MSRERIIEYLTEHGPSSSRVIAESAQACPIFYANHCTYLVQTGVLEYSAGLYSIYKPHPIDLSTLIPDVLEGIVKHLPTRIRRVLSRKYFVHLTKAPPCTYFPVVRRGIVFTAHRVSFYDYSLN